MYYENNLNVLIQIKYGITSVSSLWNPKCLYTT